MKTAAVAKDSQKSSRLRYASGFSISWWLGLVMVGAVTGFSALAESPQPASSALPSATPHPIASPHSVASSIPVASPSPIASPTPVDAKSLLKEFQRAQGSELKALSHRQKMELKELKASQRARQKEWERQEKEARHSYFAQTHKGPERRTYIKEFIDRRDAFLKMLNEERRQRGSDQEVRYKALRQEQASRLQEFKQALQQGARPADRLWPGSQ